MVHDRYDIIFCHPPDAGRSLNDRVAKLVAQKPPHKRCYARAPNRTRAPRAARTRRAARRAQVADRESKLAAAATTLYNLARAVAPKFTDDTPEWS